MGAPTDFVDVPVEVFGGYCTSVPPSDLPTGASPNATDVCFPEATVATRPGIGAGYFPAKGNSNFNGLKPFPLSLNNWQLIALDAVGNLYQENPQGTLNLLFSGTAGTFLSAVNLFGRQFMAFGNATGGVDPPRQFDGVNLYRLSQGGPGIPPSVVDEVVSYNQLVAPNGATQLAASTVAAGPNGAVQVGNLVTITLSVGNLPTYAKVGDVLKMSGIGVPGYNGNFAISRIISPTVFQYVCSSIGLAASGGGTVDYPYFIYTLAVNPIGFTVGMRVTAAATVVAGYNVTSTVRQVAAAVVVTIGNAYGLAASGTGTLAPVGNITAGLHQVSVAFITNQGFITKPAVAPASWNAAGNLRAALSNIVTGPVNIVARLVMFTQAIVAPAVNGIFYSITSTMLINDNVTTSAIMDFSDVVLAANFNCQYLFNLTPLGPCYGLNSYNGRLVAIGELSKITNFLNMGFDGGFVPNGQFAANSPLGWTPDPNVKGTFVQAQDFITGMTTYGIIGTGVDNICGMITQPAFQDWLGVNVIQPFVRYDVRVRARYNPNGAVPVAGQISVDIFSPSQGQIGAFPIPIGQLTNTYKIYSGVMFVAQGIPADALLRVYVSLTPTLNSEFDISDIEIFAETQPLNSSIARISLAQSPESFSTNNGQVIIRSNDGQAIRASFQIRGSLYFGKDAYLCHVTDDGQNEPALWAVTEDSSTIGICGPNALDTAEEWAVFANENGVYMFWGQDPVKINQEIYEDVSGTGKICWSSINWAAKTTIWVKIDQQNKRVLVGAPVNGAVSPNVIFSMDYKFSISGEAAASAVAPSYSVFSGKMLEHGSARKWAVWNIAASSATLIPRADGSTHMFLGNGSANGKIYDLLFSQKTDNAAAINSTYQFYGNPTHEQEQAFQLGAGRKFFGYLTGRAIGKGIMNLLATSPYRAQIIRGINLDKLIGDFERIIQVSGERVFFTASTDGVAGSWFQLEKFIPRLKKHPTTPVRGASA